MNLNLFVALSTSAKNAVNTRLRWKESDGEYTGPVSDTEHKIFRRMAHHSQTIDKWKSATFAGKTWTLFNLTFSDPDRQLKKALDYLTANRGNTFRVVGAWWWDSRQVGTQFVYAVDGEQIFDETLDDDGNVISSVPQVKGTPTYPIPAQLIQFMPDDVDWTDPNNPIFTPATELKQVNKEQDMADRRFT